MKFRYIISSLLAISTAVCAHGAKKLTGAPIGSKPAEIGTGLPAHAFDGKYDTGYVSEGNSYSWVGLDLGSPHVITRIGFSPLAVDGETGTLQLGVFEGANLPDFMDAVPIYIISGNDAPEKKTTYADIKCSRGFRYVRYVGPAKSKCSIAEIEFYGSEGSGDDSKLYQLTNLPTVVIHTEGKNEPTGKEKQDELISRIMIISEDGTKLLDASGTTRLRGNASMTFEKKPYRIKFDKKQNVLDAPAKAKKWTLINNYGDKTLLRNDLAFEIARHLKMPYVPYLTSVDVILNGEYKGNYQLCDHVEVKEGRLEIEEMEATDNEGEALTGGYFMEIDPAVTEAANWFITPRWIPVSIKSPDDDVLTPEQKQYINDYFVEMEDALWAGEDDDFEKFRSMFDLDSFFRHFLVGEISGNTDTYWSVFMYKHRGNPLIYTGPVWDFDIAFENDYRTYPINRRDGFIYDSGRASSVGKMFDFVNRIVNDIPGSKKAIRTLWENALNDGLNAKVLSEYFEKRARRIDDSQRLNFIRWDILDKYVHANPEAVGSYEGEVKRVSKYLAERFDHLNNYISQFSDTNGIDDIISGEGNIIANGSEVAAVGFGKRSAYTVVDMTGRVNASGSFNGEFHFDLPEGMVILTVTDGETGRTVTRKIAH